MREHLVFLLSAPMASFGGYAGHEHRGSGLVPLRSGVLGLIGASLGIKRTDSEGQAALREYSVAVCSHSQSTALRDFHTVQTVPSAKVKKPRTRAYALDSAENDVHTMVTRRDYRTDVLIKATVWGDGHWSLSKIADSLKHPRYTLYLGRKSCPLSSPVNPVVVNAADPVEALDNIEIPEWLQPGRQYSFAPQGPVYSDPVEGARPLSIEQVPSEPLDRTVWTFSQREVWVLDDRHQEQENTN